MPSVHDGGGTQQPHIYPFELAKWDADTYRLAMKSGTTLKVCHAVRSVINGNGAVMARPVELAASNVRERHWMVNAARQRQQTVFETVFEELKKEVDELKRYKPSATAPKSCATRKRQNSLFDARGFDDSITGKLDLTDENSWRSKILMEQL